MVEMLKYFYLILLGIFWLYVSYSFKGKSYQVNYQPYKNHMLLFSVLIMLDSFTTHLFVQRLGIGAEGNPFTRDLFNLFGHWGMFLHSVTAVIIVVYWFDMQRKDKRWYPIHFILLYVVFIVAININWYVGVLGN